MVTDGAKDELAAAKFRGLGIKPRRGIYLLGIVANAWKSPVSFSAGSLDPKRGSLVVAFDRV
jgi:hypothetical protein